MKSTAAYTHSSQNFITNLSDIFFVGKSLDVRITSIDPDSGKIVASVRQALPTALAAANLEVGQTVGGIISQIHPEQVVINLVPYQTTALLSLSNLSNHRQMSVEDLRSTLTTGEMLDDLIVVSKNSTSGLLIVANKRSSKTPSGVSRSAESIDNMEVGVITPGHVLSHTPGGAMIQLGSGTRGRVHPCDAADDFSAIASGAGPLNVDDDVMCYVLKTNTSTRIIDLSTRPSRIQPDKASEVVDKEIQEIADLREGQPIRGLVKNLSQHGVFVALGRTVTARIMIKEMFDDVRAEAVLCGSSLITISSSRTGNPVLRPISSSLELS